MSFNLPFPIESENICYFCQFKTYNIDRKRDEEIPNVAQIINRLIVSEKKAAREKT